MLEPAPVPEDLIPLHHLELRILLALADGPSHGYRIVKEVEELEGGRFKLYPANLYRRIRDLSDKGLLTEVAGPADDEGGGRPRTYFETTDLGRKVVRAEVARLEALLRDARAALKGA